MEEDQSLMKSLYDAITESDLTALKDLASRAPHVLEAGWLGGDTQSYLHLAAQMGRFEVCKALVELGIDVNRRDVSGGDAVPLGVAARGGHAEICRWLLDQGALVDGQPTTVSSPLMDASIEGHVEIVEMLLDRGAEINRESLSLPETALDSAIAFRSRVRARMP